MGKEKIGFGGGCHWCTEAVFDSLKGVEQVQQGWIASDPPNDTLSEAVLVHFDPNVISLEVLIEIHLRTHQSDSNHSMRHKYRSAVYAFNDNIENARNILERLSVEFEKPLVTQVLPYVAFRSSPETYQNYYKKHRDKPFCRTYIDPKLQFLRKRFRSNVQNVTKSD